jgi:hypothetical protein
MLEVSASTLQWSNCFHFNGSAGLFLRVGVMRRTNSYRCMWPLKGGSIGIRARTMLVICRRVGRQGVAVPGGEKTG